MTARLFAWAALSLCLLTPAYAIDTGRKDVSAFIDEMVKEYRFDRAELVSVLAEAEIKQSILDAISTPAEKTLSWAEYRRSSLPGSACLQGPHSGASTWTR